MTKKEKIRNSYLLLIFSFLIESFNDRGFSLKEIDNIDLSKLDKDDLLIISIYRWLKNIRKIFAKPNVQKFAFNRLKKSKPFLNEKEYKADKLIVALFLFYLYLDLKQFDDKKDWIIPPFKKDEIKELILSFDRITKDTSEFCYDIVRGLDPSKESILYFREISGRLFKPIKEGDNNGDSKDNNVVE